MSRAGEFHVSVVILDTERRQPPAERKRHDIETMLQQAVDEIDGP